MKGLISLHLNISVAEPIIPVLLFVLSLTATVGGIVETKYLDTVIQVTEQMRIQTLFNSVSAKVFVLVTEVRT